MSARSSYIPSRPAPSPPTHQYTKVPPTPKSIDTEDDLPSDHPFANPYTPPQPFYVRHNSSSISLDSAYTSYTLKTPPVSPNRSSNHRESFDKAVIGRPRIHVHSSISSSPYSSKYSSPSFSTTSRSDSSFKHTLISSTRTQPKYTPQISTITPRYFPAPADLSILDSRNGCNLLNDIEFISGKKLNFPFLKKFQLSSRQDKGDEKKIWWKSNSEDKGRRRKLSKERYLNDEEEFRMEVQLLQSERRQAGTRRGAKEGNWI